MPVERDTILAHAVVTSVFFIAGALHKLIKDVNDKNDMNDKNGTEWQQQQDGQANGLNYSQRQSKGRMDMMEYNILFSRKKFYCHFLPC